MSESVQLQTLISDLTVRDVSLRLYATSLYATPDSRLFQLLLLGDITGGNGGCKHQSMDRGPNHILNLWEVGLVQEKLEGLLLFSLSQLYDITQ